MSGTEAKSVEQLIEENRELQARLRNAEEQVHALQNNKQGDLLRQSEDRYSTLLNAMLEGVVIHDSDGTIQSCNLAAERILGLSAAQMMGRTNADPRWSAIHEDGSPFPGETHPATMTLRTGQSFANVVMGVHKPDGSLSWILINSQAIFAPGQQRPAAVVATFADITELKRNNARLAYLASIVTSSNDAIVSETLEGIITSWNLGAERTFGYTAEEVIGKPILVIFPPERIDEEKTFLEKIAAGETIYGVDTIRLKKDGSEVSVSITVSPIQDEQGTIVGAAKIIRDITDRKRAEKQLLQSEASLKQAQRVARVGSWAWNIATNHLEWSDEMYRIFGISRQSFTGNLEQVVSQAIHPDDRAAVEKSNAAVVEEKNPQPLEYRIVHPDGSVRVVWAEAGQMTLDSDGNPILLTGIVQDITERKTAEASLRRTIQRLEASNRLSRALTSDPNLSNFYEAFVQELRALVQFDRVSIILLNHAGDQFQIVSQWANHPPPVPTGEWRFVAGTSIEWVVKTARPLLEDGNSDFERWRESALLQQEGVRSRFVHPMVLQGNVVGLLAVAKFSPDGFSGEDQAIIASIAEQLATAVLSSRLYKEVQRNTVELEQRVQERTAQLQAANRELEAFSYSISHDLRAPLRAIDGFSRIIQRDFANSLPAEGQRNLQRVRDGAQQMGRLIDDLLAFSRLGRQPFRKQHVALADIVKNVIDELQIEQEQRHIEITVGELPVVGADPSLIKQVFANLLANAVKFTGHRAVAQIEVGYTPTDAGGVFFVRDNGAGFDMAYADKLFGVFQRLHRAEEFSGTGVGLAIVQRIIQRHGGRIWAKAETDRGATFYFSLDGGAQNG